LSGRRTSFGKLERERTKKAKAVAKREQRQARSEAPDDADLESDSANGSSGEVEMPAEQVLELVNQLHQRFDAKLIDYEAFEEQKADLLGRLKVD